MKIATTVPHITDEFHALNNVGWYVKQFRIHLDYNSQVSCYPARFQVRVRVYADELWLPTHL